jgi:hypothetical protein
MIIEKLDLRHIPNVLNAYVAFDGHEPVLHVETDLPLNTQLPGFDAEKLDDFGQAIADFMKHEAFFRSEVHSTE